MGLALIGGGNVFPSGFQNEYGLATAFNTATEAQAARVMRVAGTFSNYGALQTGTTTCTLNWKKNSVNGNGAVVFSGAAGAIYDNVNTDTYKATDTRDFHNNLAAGNISCNWVKSLFSAAVGHATIHANSSTPGTASTCFGPIHARVGANTTWPTTESFAQSKMRTSGTLQFAWISVTTATTSTATLISRKNGVNGNINISITANATGIFEDTSNSDTFVSGDLLNFQLSGQSSGIVMLGGLSSWLNYNSNTNEVFTGSAITIGSAVTAFLPVVGNGFGASPFSTESQIQLQHGFGGNSQNMRVNAAANTQNASTTFTYRINGANGNQTFTVGAGATGWFEDSTHVDNFGPTDLCAIQYSTASSSGALTLGPVITTESPFQFLPSATTPPGFGPISRWPISVVGGKVTVEFIGPDKYMTPLSEPVRFKAGLAPHLQQFLAFNPLPIVPQVTSWFMPLSEPVRALPRNWAALYPHLFQQPAPSPFVATGWFMPLSEPVRFKPALHPSLQQFTTKDTNPTPIVVFKWFMPLSEPVRFKPALLTALQQFLAWEPRTLKTPDIFAQLRAVELKDLFTGSAKRFFTIQGGEIGIFDVANPTGEIGLTEEPSPGTVSIVGGSISVSER